MRSILGLYLGVGLILLVFGFVATGPCPDKNTDAVNDAVFVLTWPVGLYGYVIAGDMSVDSWLHTQSCGPGLAPQRAQLSR